MRRRGEDFDPSIDSRPRHLDRAPEMRRSIIDPGKDMGVDVDESFQQSLPFGAAFIRAPGPR